MSRNCVRRPITWAAAVAMALSMASCASTGDLLGNFAGRADQLGYDTCEQRDVSPHDEQTVEAMFICHAGVGHAVWLTVFDTTSARETWTDEFGPAYDDSGTALIGHGRWVIAGNDFDHVKELAKGLGAPLAST